MIHPGELDWWIWIYSPAIFLALGFIIGFRRLAVIDRLRCLVPMAVLLLIRIFVRWTDIFSGDPFFYFTALLFTCCWIFIENLNIPGLAIFSLGGILNAIVAASNGGKMPFFGGLVATEFYSPIDLGTKLFWLSDWINTPSGLYVLSPGDLFLILGSAIFLMGEIRFRIQNRNILKK